MISSWGKWLALFVSSGAFSGFLPGWIIGKRGAGGGLAGSTLALMIQVIFLVFGIRAEYLVAGCLSLLIFSFAIVPVAEAFMCAKWGERKRHTGEMVIHDFNETNIDEVVGQLIAGLPVFLSFASSLDFWTKIVVLLGTFVTFRFLEITKPLGIRWVEKSLSKKEHWAASIMLDDVLAGGYAFLIGAIACLLLS